MNYLSVAQYMASAAFFATASTHVFVWTRARGEIPHLLFAVTAAAMGANAIAEESVYRADSIELMCTALRWYVTTSGCWAIATVCFFAAYAHVGRWGWCLAIAIAAACTVGMVINLFSPASLLFTEVTSLRDIVLPWGEHIHLAVGEDNPQRIMTDLAFVAILGVVADGCYQFWRSHQRTRAVFFGATVFGFMACFFVHAYLVDTGSLDFPYISTYGFLALVGLMSYDLGGEVVRAAPLSIVIERKDTELQLAVAEERSRIARDLHDSVTQTLFSTAAIADALPEVWQRRPDDTLRGLDDLKHLTKGALAEMRTLLTELHPVTLTEKPLGELLRQLGTSTSGRTRTPIDVKINAERRLPDEVQVTFYRAAQEALHNVVKHADASQIVVRLACNGPSVSLSICDDGCGFDAFTTKSAGLGLSIMRERVRAISANLDVNTEPGAGTTVSVQWTDNSGDGNER